MKKIALATIVLLIVLTLAGGALFRKQGPALLPPFAPTPTSVAGPSVRFDSINYQEIFPDPKMAQMIADTLRTASGSSQIDDYTVVSFPTDVEQRPNLVYEKGNVAKYIVQERTVDNTDLRIFQDAHPDSQAFQMFDNAMSGSGFSWYVFSQDGIAYLANKEFGYAIKVLYFPKTSKENFVQTAGKTFGLLETDPESAQESFEETP